MRKERDTPFWRFVRKLHNPPNWVAVLVFATTLVVCPLIVLTLTVNYVRNSYVVIGCLLCGILLVYTTTVLVNGILRIRRKVLNVADRYEFTRNLHKNYEFRTRFFTVLAFLGNVVYTIFLMATAFRYRSVWYGAIGIYYILLSISRGGVLIQRRKDERKYHRSEHELQRARVGTYRYCGVMMLILAVSLAISVVELVVNNSGFRMSPWLLVVFAGVAVYKVANGFIHFVRSIKHGDLVVRAVRYINLAVTLMSVLCLQTAILAVLPMQPLTASVLNGITGAFVCAVTLALGVFIILFAAKEKKKLLASEVALAQNLEKATVGYNRDGYGEEYHL